MKKETLFTLLVASALTGCGDSGKSESRNVFPAESETSVQYQKSLGCWARQNVIEILVNEGIVDEPAIVRGVDSAIVRWRVRSNELGAKLGKSSSEVRNELDVIQYDLVQNVLSSKEVSQVQAELNELISRAADCEELIAAVE